MKVLIAGAGGQLGRALQTVLIGQEVIALTHEAHHASDAERRGVHAQIRVIRTRSQEDEPELGVPIREERRHPQYVHQQCWRQPVLG